MKTKHLYHQYKWNFTDVLFGITHKLFQNINQILVGLSFEMKGK